MVTQFVTLDLPLPALVDLHRSILRELQTQGEPLRWAITAIDLDQQRVQVEAVVTISTPFRVPPGAVTTV